MMTQAVAERKRKTKERRFLKRNLVYLVYAPNTCYSRLLSKCPENITLNLEEETWTHGGTSIPIGKASHLFYVREGTPLGVFDRTKFQHLEEMLEAERHVADRLRPVSLDD